MPTIGSIAEAPPELQQKLEDAGYETIDDIKEAGVLEVIQGEPSLYMSITPFPFLCHFVISLSCILTCYINQTCSYHLLKSPSCCHLYKEVSWWYFHQFMRSSIDIQWQIGQIHASQSAQDRLVADSSKTGISCTSSALNNLFASYKGIPYGCITEFCGEAGSGKTQLRYTLNEWEELIYLSPLFSMQLAVNALLPSELGGSEGECIYIGN